MRSAGQGSGRAMPWTSDRGYAMAALLVGLSITAVLMTAAMPVWSQMNRREKEEELIWRGQQYARAVALFQRKYANAYPATLDVLVDQKFLRKKYKDPITGEDFQLIPAGAMGQPTPGLGAGRGSASSGGPALPAPGGMPGAMPGRGQAAGVGAGFSMQPPTPAPETQGGSATLQFQTQSPVGGGAGTGIAGQRPAAGIAGVVSKSTDTSIKIYNGRTKYNEWAFVAVQTSQQIGPGSGTQFPGVPPGRGTPFPGGPGTFQPVPGGRGSPPLGPGQQPGRGFTPLGPGQPPGPGFNPFAPGPPGQSPGSGVNPFAPPQQPPMPFDPNRPIQVPGQPPPRPPGP